MRATRRTQPYRKGTRMAGPASMYAGKPMHGPNPMDTQRALTKAVRRKPRRRPPRGKLAARLMGR